MFAVWGPLDPKGPATLDFATKSKISVFAQKASLFTLVNNIPTSKDTFTHGMISGLFIQDFP